MAKPCIKSRFHFILVQQDRCAAMLPIIWSPSPVNRMSRSWKARPLSAILFPVACREDRLFLIGSSVMRRKAVNLQTFILNNRRRALQVAESFHAVMKGRGRRNECKPKDNDEPPGHPTVTTSCQASSA